MSVRSPRVRTQSFLPSICHIYIISFRIVLGFGLDGNLTQLMLPHVISVRQTRSLPPASFRFPVAGDTLALSYALGTINPCSGLSPVRLRPCRAHHRSGHGDSLSDSAANNRLTIGRYGSIRQPQQQTAISVCCFFSTGF